jgi:hypothetical protein
MTYPLAISYNSSLWKITVCNIVKHTTKWDTLDGRRITLEPENRIISEHTEKQNTGKSHFIQKFTGEMLRPRT